MPERFMEEWAGKSERGEEERELASLWSEGRDAKSPVRTVTGQGQAADATLAKMYEVGKL